MGKRDKDHSQDLEMQVRGSTTETAADQTEFMRKRGSSLDVEVINKLQKKEPEKVGYGYGFGFNTPVTDKGKGKEICPVNYKGKGKEKEITTDTDTDTDTEINYEIPKESLDSVTSTSSNYSRGYIPKTPQNTPTSSDIRLPKKYYTSKARKKAEEMFRQLSHQDSPKPSIDSLPEIPNPNTSIGDSPIPTIPTPRTSIDVGSGGGSGGSGGSGG